MLSYDTKFWDKHFLEILFLMNNFTKNSDIILTLQHFLAIFKFSQQK